VLISCRTLTLKSVGAIPAAMTRSDLEVANDFVRRWYALSKQRRARHGGEMPVAALQVAALSHPDLAIRRSCLFLLDHYASDASWNVFRLALRDPVPSVREGALHGLSCERCRTEDLCVADVVTDLIDILASDPNVEVRHKGIAALARFLDRDGRAREAIARTASDDPDSAIRLVARTVVDRGQPHVRGRKSALRDAQRLRRSGH
jgi:HEAT repeat protein